ncbi:hypothetical protein CC80DRAFT_594083 [Byssothecium circinans]|uniref:Uncharacterized protein n=1 Tax=Byssothecium circinans TaxID=147558 RepID=A0A6A5TV50_9PLEO|nr:hypothetical protein CC80DRAFT_594083 [Byssothecium circinans]
MDTDVFCILCGGPFALEQGVYSVDPDKEEFQWLYQAHLLGTISALRNLRMTSAAELHSNLCDSETIFLSGPASWKITDSGFFQLDQSIYHVLAEDDAGDALFPLHWACIDIAYRVIDSHMTERKTADFTFTALYQTLRCHLRAEQKEKDAKHDILQLHTICSKSGPRGILAIDELEWWSGAYEVLYPMHRQNLPHTGHLSCANRRMSPVALF